MYRVLRRLTLALVLVCGAVFAGSLEAQATDPLIGTWKLNVAKSMYTPGPVPKSQTVKFESSGQGVKVTVDGVNADGTRMAVTQYTANYDGKDKPLTGSPDVNMVSLMRIDARTSVRTDKKDGKILATRTRVVSPDDKMLTITSKGTNAQGQPFNEVGVYDKQ